MQQTQGFAWYRAFRVISLVLAILMTVSCALGIVAALVFQSLGASEPMPMGFLSVVEVIRSLVIQVLVQGLLTAVLFYALWATLRKGSEAAVWLALALNVFLPVQNLLIIPRTNNYFRIMATFLAAESGAAEIFPMINMMTAIIPGASVMGAVTGALILLPNTIYFFKRRGVMARGAVGQPVYPAGPDSSY